MVEAAEEAQVFTPGEARVKTEVTAGVTAELAPDGAGLENTIVSRDFHVTVGGEEQRGENFEERGFAGAIRAQ